MGKRLHIELPRRDRQQLNEILSGGLQPVRTVLRALALRQMDGGQGTPEVARNLGLSAKAVWQIGRRYLEGGLERALFEAPRPGKSPVLDQEQRQRVIAVACSPPPEGRARWTVRLLDRRSDVRRKLVPRVGRESIRILLESHDLKPWREKNVVRGQAGSGIHSPSMEDVLELYEKPPSSSEPVVCIDEKPVVLHRDLRACQPMLPGRVGRRDYEYKRCGTANVFCGTEPKAGRHFTKVTPTRRWA